MPEKILNMDWEELLDLIQEFRSGLADVRDTSDGQEFLLDWAEKLAVGPILSG